MEYATFVTDEKFYERLADKIDCSQKLFTEIPYDA